MNLSAAIKTLLILSGIFFAVFAYFCDLWTWRNPKEAKNILCGVTVSFFWTFKILVLSFLVILAIFLVFK